MVSHVLRYDAPEWRDEIKSGRLTKIHMSALMLGEMPGA
jgi:hypothetical protein